MGVFDTWSARNLEPLFTPYGLKDNGKLITFTKYSLG